MYLNIISGIFILLTVLECYYTGEIPNYADTVNITNVQQFKNGSYLYENEILITPDLVAVYEYEELVDGKRIEVEPHLRGCVCKTGNCLKLCCYPNKELNLNYTTECLQIEMDEELKYDPYINIIYSNGSRVKKHATKEFVMIPGAPCKGAYWYLHAQDDQNKWDIYENGTLYRHSDNSYISKNDYCLIPNKVQNDTWIFNAIYCDISDIMLSTELSVTGRAASVPFIVLTIFVYLFLPELCNFHGKCLISYLTSLALDDTIYSMVALAEYNFPKIPCLVLGYLGYFFAIAVFFWQSVISFDLWQNFRNTGPISFGQGKRFLMYSAYGWGLPLCLTFLAMIIQNSDIDVYYKPGIQGGSCWLKITEDDWSAMIYFFSINLVINLLNTVFFIMTIYKIIIIKKEIKRMININDEYNLRLNKNNVGIFLRLLLIMGVSWLLDIFSYVHFQLNPYITNPLCYVIDGMNAMMGVLIFICFVLKPNVVKLINRRFQTIWQERTHLLRGQ